MKFVDEATITVQAGDGGNGCMSFRREKCVPRGGPDGGDGGKGGDVMLRATSRKRTLYDFHFRQHFKASSGKPGQGKQKTGRNGEDCIIEVPPGTLIYDEETGRLLADLIDDGDNWVAARGGRGGAGNARFKTATNQAPRTVRPGQPGEFRKLKLELKLIADVGLVGLPNAGKSTLIRTISAARPKVADYPFTTLHPNLGVVQTRWREPFVVADIPGLIDGAHRGAGLGTRFLRHIERTRILVHLMDATSLDPEDPLENYRIIRNELAAYRQELSRKPQIIVLNKMDLPGAEAGAAAMRRAMSEEDVLEISAKTGHGVDRLLSKIIATLDAENESGEKTLL